MLMKTRPERQAQAWQPSGGLPRRDAGPAIGQRPDDPFLACCAGAAVQHLTPEARLYARGGAGTNAWVVSSGIVRFERVTVSGMRRISRIAGAGDLIGQEALLGECYRDDAVACTQATLRRVRTPLPGESAWADCDVPWSLMRRWQETLDRSEHWATEVATGSSRHRVLQLLAHLRQHVHHADLIWLPKRDQMGDMLQLTIETCSRVLSTLRREGVLEFVPPRRARVNDERLVQALAGSNA